MLHHTLREEWLRRYQLFNDSDLHPDALDHGAAFIGYLALLPGVELFPKCDREQLAAVAQSFVESGCFTLISETEQLEFGNGLGFCQSGMVYDCYDSEMLLAMELGSAVMALCRLAESDPSATQLTVNGYSIPVAPRPVSCWVSLRESLSA